MADNVSTKMTVVNRNSRNSKVAASVYDCAQPVCII